MESFEKHNSEHSNLTATHLELIAEGTREGLSFKPNIFRRLDSLVFEKPKIKLSQKYQLDSPNESVVNTEFTILDVLGKMPEERFEISNVSVAGKA